MHRCDRIPKISKQPVPSHHRSPTRWQTVRGHELSPITVSRRSKIGPINSPRQHACKSRCGRIPEVSIQPAPSYHRSSTGWRTVRGHGIGLITASRRSKIGPINSPHQMHLHASPSHGLGVTGYPRLCKVMRISRGAIDRPIHKDGRWQLLLVGRLPHVSCTSSMPVLTLARVDPGPRAGSTSEAHAACASG